MDVVSKFNEMKEAILKDYPRLSENDSFQFACRRNMPCFTQCCADVNIALTPYDILRMKDHLGITSGEFLSRYTIIPFSKEQRFPVVILRMQDNARKTCYFVDSQGCSIYEDRPWACRMYPVGVASPREEEEQKFYFILKEEPCEGHDCRSTWTIRSWMSDQGVDEYDKLGEEFKEISLNKFFEEDGTLEPAQMDMLFMALYDVDKFRRFVFESSFLQRFQMSAAEKKRIKNDDVELLRFGFRWLKFCLFGESVIKIRKEIRQSKLQAAAASVPKPGS